MQEYANDVVHHIQSVCNEAEVAHPNIISESGRALVAYHSALIFGVLGTSVWVTEESIPSELPEDAEQQIKDLLDTYRNVTTRNVLESFHDAQQAMDVTMTLSPRVPVPGATCAAELIFWGTCKKIRRLMEQIDYVPEELQGLDSLLSDTYFCNFSLFQSMPDSWAIKQLFPSCRFIGCMNVPHAMLW